MSQEEHDLIIIGGGPAGLTAGLYGVRAKLKTLLLEKLPLLGGQIVNAEEVENYPGFPDGISGPELITRMETQARKFGLVIKTGDVSGLRVEGDIKRVILEEGDYCNHRGHWRFSQSIRGRGRGAPYREGNIILWNL